MLKKKRLKKFCLVLLACLCAFSGYSLSAFAAGNAVVKNDQNGIPDKGLYRAVQDALGKKRNQTFTEEEAANLKKLEIPFRYKVGIKSLKGIGYLSNLDRLDISGYGLKSLKGVEKLPKLTSLVAEDNNLKNLQSVSKAKNLISLYVGGNKLKSLKGIEGLRKLEYLGIQNNRLTTLKELKNLTQLKQLEAKENKLTSLKGMEWLKRLNYIDVRCNNIKSLKAIKRLRKITYLDVSYNELNSLEGLRCINSIKSLYASHNNLKKIPNLAKNQKINVRSCNIEFNYLKEEEIRNKLPKRFFRKGKVREYYIGRQLYYQNIKEGMDFITPADGRITKDITRIIGRVHKEAEVRLRNVTKGISLDPVKADENGVFVMDHLDLREWAGDQIEFQYTGDIGDVISLPKLTVLG